MKLRMWSISSIFFFNRLVRMGSKRQDLEFPLMKHARCKCRYIMRSSVYGTLPYGVHEATVHMKTRSTVSLPGGHNYYIVSFLSTVMNALKWVILT